MEIPCPIYKDNKRRSKPTHHVLANQILQETPTRTECSDPGIKPLWHPPALRHKMLMNKTQKIGSQGANVPNICNSARHGINSSAKNTGPCRSRLHRTHTR